MSDYKIHKIKLLHDVMRKTAISTIHNLSRAGSSRLIILYGVPRFASTEIGHITTTEYSPFATCDKIITIC